MTRDERLRYQSRLEELSQTSSAIEPLNAGKAKEVKIWERVQANAMPGIDTFGQPVLHMGDDDNSAQVGLSRANISSGSESPELAAGLMEARIRQELRPGPQPAKLPAVRWKKIWRCSSNCLAKPREVVTPASTNDSSAQVSADSR